MGTQQQFCLRWNNHQMNMLSVFDQLLQNESFVDVTLACDGLSLKAHKVVLSACSPYFQKLLLDNPCPHPIVILKDVNYADLKALVDFMYKGEVSVLQDQLEELLKTADLLKIRGLSEVSPASSNMDGGLVQRQNLGNNSKLSGCISATVVTPLPTSSLRSSPLGSPPSKRKRGRPRRKSGSLSDSEDNVLDMDGPPEVIESKVDVPQVTLTMDDSSQSTQCNVNNGLHMPKDEDSETNSEQCPSHSKVHEGFSQENEDMNASNLDPPTLLGMSGFSSSQFNSSLSAGLPLHLTDAAVDDDNKNTIQKLVEFSDPTTASVAIAAASIATTLATTSEHSSCEQGDSERRSVNSMATQWTTNDMSSALDAIRQGRVTITKASTLYSIPSTTLWQRARREGIDTRRDLTIASNWTEDDLHQALEAVRSGKLSITKAAVTFGIPNTTLWQRSRREGIDTSRSTGIAHQSNWTEANLSQALEAIRTGRMSVNKASSTFGIPSTTLWSRAKRYGIETGRKSIWEQDRDEVMWQALQAVKAGMVSMTQASIKFNVPYTTLWKHFKKWEMSTGTLAQSTSSTSSTSSPSMSLSMPLPPPPPPPPLLPPHHHHHHSLASHPPPHHSSHSAPMSLGHHLGVPIHSHPHSLSHPSHQHPHSHTHPHPIENILPENTANNTMNS